MITRIREVRRARGMTLDDVARACDPPTTPQTIGRLETGTRTVSVGWLNRIAAALGVEASDLVESRRPARISASSRSSAPTARRRPGEPPWWSRPGPAPGQVAVTVSASLGDYRAGDEIWCDVLAARRLRPRAQSRRAGPAAGRAVPVRPADRPRGSTGDNPASFTCSRPAPAAARASSPIRPGWRSRSGWSGASEANVCFGWKAAIML